MKKILVASMVVATISLGACAPTETTNRSATNANATAAASPVATATPRPTATPQDDKTFAMNGAQSNMAEIALGRLAVQKTKNADIKKFAQRLIADHSNANTQLKALAAKKAITLPADVKPEQKETYDRIAKLSGAEFDREFMTLMVENHTKSATAYQAESSNGTDAELKAFAAKVLPIVQEHLSMARDIQGKLPA